MGVQQTHTRPTKAQRRLEAAWFTLCFLSPFLSDLSVRYGGEAFFEHTPIVRIFESYPEMLIIPAPAWSYMRVNFVSNSLCLVYILFSGRISFKERRSPHDYAMEESILLVIIATLFYCLRVMLLFIFTSEGDVVPGSYFPAGSDVLGPTLFPACNLTMVMAIAIVVQRETARRGSRLGR